MKVEITVSKSELFTKLWAVAKIIKPEARMVSAHDDFLFRINEGFTVTGADQGGIITAGIEECRFTPPDEEIRCLVDRSKLLAGLKELPEQPITLAFAPMKDETYDLLVKYDKGEYKITAAKETGSFALLKPDPKPTLCRVHSSELVPAIKKLHRFAGTDDLRPVMTGIYIAQSGGTLTFAATDAATLGVMDYLKPANPDETFEIVLPEKIAKIISDLLKDETVEMEIGERNVLFRFGPYRVVYRMLEDKYLRFRQVIPQNNHLHLRCNVAELAGSLRRVSIFTNVASGLVRLTASDGQLRLAGQDVDLSLSAVETLKVDYADPEIEIGFKNVLLSKCLEAIDTADVKMSFSDPTRPCLITRADEDDVQLTILIMPLMINV